VLPEAIFFAGDIRGECGRCLARLEMLVLGHVMSRSFWVVGARLRMPQLQFFVAGAILFTLFTKDGESCKSYSGTVTSNVASDVWFLSLVVAGAALSSQCVRV
jgi:hypothetical protein